MNFWQCLAFRIKKLVFVCFSLVSFYYILRIIFFSDVIKNYTIFLELDGKYYPLQNDALNPASSSILVMDNGTLSIIGIKKENEGVYQCTASNEVGLSLKKSASLRVIGENWMKFPFS